MDIVKTSSVGPDNVYEVEDILGWNMLPDFAMREKRFKVERTQMVGNIYSSSITSYPKMKMTPTTVKVLLFGRKGSISSMIRFAYFCIYLDGMLPREIRMIIINYAFIDAYHCNRVFEESGYRYLNKVVYWGYWNYSSGLVHPGFYTNVCRNVPFRYWCLFEPASETMILLDKQTPCTRCGLRLNEHIKELRKDCFLIPFKWAYLSEFDDCYIEGFGQSVYSIETNIGHFTVIWGQHNDGIHDRDYKYMGLGTSNWTCTSCLNNTHHKCRLCYQIMPIPDIISGRHYVGEMLVDYYTFKRIKAFKDVNSNDPAVNQEKEMEKVLQLDISCWDTYISWVKGNKMNNMSSINNLFKLCLYTTTFDYSFMVQCKYTDPEFFKSLFFRKGENICYGRRGYNGKWATKVVGIDYGLLNTIDSEIDYYGKRVNRNDNILGISFQHSEIDVLLLACETGDDYDCGINCSIDTKVVFNESASKGVFYEDREIPIDDYKPHRDIENLPDFSTCDSDWSPSQRLEGPPVVKYEVNPKYLISQSK